MRVLGIDPGIRGGLAIISLLEGDMHVVDAIDVPVIGVAAKERVDVLGLQEWVLKHEPQRAFIERAQAMPKQGASSGFKYGRATGSLEAVIISNNIPLQIVEPAFWKRSLHLRGKDKEGARQHALLLFPHAHSLLRLKQDHGRAEAMLIAYVGIRHLMPVGLGSPTMTAIEVVQS
jgi:crossover junction endodeoxyribonuclease RuvC